MSQVAGIDAFDPRARGVTPWRQALIFLTLLSIWTLFLYRNTGVAMVSIWARSGTFTHAFLVPPIAAWLIWRKRQILALYTPEPNGYVLIGVVLVALMWGMGELASVNALTQWVLVALLVLAVPAILGMTVARLISFPLFFLFFAVPVGEFLMPPLMEGTAHFTVFALRMSGIPVYREGLQFVIPTGNWSVVEACSGVRYLIASVTVGTLFSYLNFQSIQRRIFFVLVSLVVPVIANWIRAYFIVVLGHISGNKIATGVDHLIYGWLFFGLVIMLMFFIGAQWAESDSKTGGIATPAGVTPFQAARLWFVTVFFALIVSLPHLALSDDEQR
jgi:exosortase A